MCMDKFKIYTHHVTNIMQLFIFYKLNTKLLLYLYVRTN